MNVRQKTAEEASPATVKAAFDRKVKAAAVARAATRDLAKATAENREILEQEKEKAEVDATVAAAAADECKRRAVAASATAKKFARMQLTSIDLTGNVIGDLGAEALLEAMSTHKTLTVGLADFMQFHQKSKGPGP
eukprot:SAG31_NODE_200_length_20519_cov_57.688833_11_plen_136_part_00